VPRFDFPVDQLRAYRPEVAEPADFDEFWALTLADSRRLAEPPLLSRVDAPFGVFDVYDVSFSGFGGDRIGGWFIEPAGREDPLPAVVEFNGYGGGVSLPHERLQWPASGYAYFFMDTRGQRNARDTGGTADPHGTGASAAGFMTRGIDDPTTYYYRRVFTDAVLAVDAVRAMRGVDQRRVAVTGKSQGGGIAIAAAGLSAGLVGAMPDVPFLCHFERAVGLTASDPYQEIVRYLSVHRSAAARSFKTLSYFDGVNFAKRATAPAIFSVGMMDPVCPPSTVFAARNHWAGHAADITEYHFNEHEGGGAAQWPIQAAWLAEQLRLDGAGRVAGRSVG